MAKPALRRTAARFHACQALFQWDVRRPRDCAPMIAEFLEHRFTEPPAHLEKTSVDKKFFAELVAGTVEIHLDLDHRISLHLQEDFATIEPMLRGILRLGLFELIHYKKIPARVIMHEYLGVGKTFLSQAQIGRVNAILDRLAREHRGEEAFFQKLPTETS